MYSDLIYREDSHKVILIRIQVSDDSKQSLIQYLIVSNGDGMLVYPGGKDHFAKIISEITKYISSGNIKTVIASRLDSYVIDSLKLWQDFVKGIRIFPISYSSQFLPRPKYFKGLNIRKIPEEGIEIPLSKVKQVYLVPSHYCFTAVNYSLFDPISKILFSGNIGSALIPKDLENEIENISFSNIRQYMQEYHEKWMPSLVALRSWADRVKALDPDMICPQHGCHIDKKDIPIFLDWISDLKVRSLNECEINGDEIWLKWKNKD